VNHKHCRELVVVLMAFPCISLRSSARIQAIAHGDARGVVTRFRRTGESAHHAEPTRATGWSGRARIMLQRASIPCRRLNPRISTNPHQPVWVYWQCNGRDYLSRIRDLGVAGLFLETSQRSTLGWTVKLDFLVQEGQIRAEGTVRHIVPGDGIGLKLIAVTDQDRAHLAALMKRLRTVAPANRTDPHSVP